MSLYPPDPDSVLNTDSESISLENRFDALGMLSKWIAWLAEEKGFSDRLVFELDLVLSEAITNIIQNAYTDEREHDITVTVSYVDGIAEVKIQDDGVFFDPLQHPEPSLPNKLEDAVEGGLGIHLIKSYVQDWNYQRLDDTNVFTLILAESQS